MGNVLDKRDKSLAPMPRSGPIDKATKFNWSKPSTPGKMMELSKHVLNIDDKYQRELVKQKLVLHIAGYWDWTQFPTLMVAQREDGTYWVFDGGTRTRAAFYRSDITMLPCIVFQMQDISDEARAFIAGAKLRNSINPIDTFKAATVANEPVAQKTATILRDLGIKAVRNATRSGELKCIQAVQGAVEENKDGAKRVLETCHLIAGDYPISMAVFRGLFHLTQHFNGRDILKTHEAELSRLTQQELEKSIRQLKAESGKGGDITYAKAIMNVLNKGKRTNKLKW